MALLEMGASLLRILIEIYNSKSASPWELVFHLLQPNYSIGSEVCPFEQIS